MNITTLEAMVPVSEALDVPSSITSLQKKTAQAVARLSKAQDELIGEILRVNAERVQQIQQALTERQLTVCSNCHRIVAADNPRFMWELYRYGKESGELAGPYCRACLAAPYYAVRHLPNPMFLHPIRRGEGGNLEWRTPEHIVGLMDGPDMQPLTWYATELDYAQAEAMMADEREYAAAGVHSSQVMRRLGLPPLLKAFNLFDCEQQPAVWAFSRR